MRIGKCKLCKGELYISGKNYFSDWEQHKCSKCGNVIGGTYQEYLDRLNKEKKEK